MSGSKFWRGLVADVGGIKKAEGLLKHLGW